MDFLFLDDTFFVFIKTILTTVGTMGMMCCLTEFKYGVKKLLLIFSFYLLWVCSSSAIIIHLGGFMLLLRLFLLTISVPAILIIYLTAKDCWTKALFNYASQINCSLLIGGMATIINMVTAGDILRDILLRVVFYTCVIFFEWFFLRRRFLHFTGRIQKGWGILSLIPVAILLLLVFMGLFPEHYIKHPFRILYIYTFALAMIVVYFAIFQNLRIQYQVQLLTRDKEILEVQVSTLASQIDVIKDTEETLRIARHDMHHRFQTLTELIHRGEINTALQLIGAADSELANVKTTHYCAHPILDALLCAYFKQAQQEGILIDAKLSIPEQLPVDALALSTVFANALENAIHACQSLPEGKRSIICKCVTSPGFVFEIANTCDGSVQLDPKGNPVAKEKGHGIGTRSIAAFVKKYDGLCVYQVDNGWFRLQIAL